MLDEFQRIRESLVIKERLTFKAKPKLREGRENIITAGWRQHSRAVAQPRSGACRALDRETVPNP